MSFVYKQYIAGEWRDASNAATWDVLNPSSEELVRTVPFGNGDDANAAIDAAAAAFPSWSGKTAYERAAILKRAADLMRAQAQTLAQDTVRESGKPLVQAAGEWNVSADLFEWFAEECKRAYGRIIPSRTSSKRLMVLKQPLGVVGIITAWNFPAYNIARSAAAALAAGCTVVIRPSEYTPLTAMAMVHLLVEAGIPAGVVNLINGEPDSMAQAMLAHEACAKIHFTGSQRVGKLLMDGASKTVTRLSLELGGNAPVIIFPDVDVAAVAASAVAAKFRNNGQVCVAPQRFLLHSQVAEEFTERAGKIVAGLKVGDGFDAQTNVGPLINARQRDRVEALVDDARNHKAEVVTGGMRPARPGYFYQPTVVANVAPASDLYEQEIFGPVLPISTFADTDEVIAYANSGNYGLAAYVWTNDLRNATRAYERLHYGLIGVNEWTPHSTEAPFVGWKQSGMGRESGAEGLEEYLETKLVALGDLG